MSLIRKLVVGISIKHNKAGVIAANRGIAKVGTAATNTGKATRRATRSLSRFNRAGFGLGITAVGVGLALGKATQALSAFVRAGAGLERQEAAFSTIFKSVELGSKMLKDVNKLAAETIFTPEETRKNAVMMRAMGIEAKAIIPTMTQFGDILAALPNLTLERLALNFGQVKSAAALTGRELRDFVSGGVPLLEELQKMTGKTATEVRDMISDKKVSFSMVQEAFDRMTSAGGRFHGMMKKYGKTAEGLFKIIRSKLFLIMERVGIKLVKKIKPLLTMFDKWLKDNKDAIVERLTRALDRLFKVLLRAVAPVTTAVTFVAEAMEGLINVSAPIVTGLMDAAAALYNFSSSVGKNIKPVGVFLDILKGARKLFTGAWLVSGIALMVGAFASLTLPITILAAKMALVVAPFLILEDMMLHFSSGGKADTYFGDMIKALDQVEGLEGIGTKMAGAFEAIFSPVILVLNVLSELIVSIFTGENFLDRLKENKVIQGYVEMWSKAFKDIKTYFSEMLDGIFSFYKNDPMFAAIRDMVDAYKWLVGQTDKSFKMFDTKPDLEDIDKMMQERQQLKLKSTFGYDENAPSLSKEGKPIPTDSSTTTTQNYYSTIVDGITISGGQAETFSSSIRDVIDQTSTGLLTSQ